MRHFLLGLCLSIAVAVGAVVPPAVADVGQRAKVQNDGTLKVNGKTVRLFGIHIPTFGRTCRTNIRPRKCAPRAVLQLDFKVSGFVFCRAQHKNPDGSISAICNTRRSREDLGAWMLRQGWAVALPGAPIEYVTLERIARANHRGFWGFQADSIR